jgi:hypothetical protein
MDDLYREFHNSVQAEVFKIKKQYKEYKTNTNKKLQRDYVKKYPFLKSNSRFPSFDEVWRWDEIKNRFEKDYENLITILIKKITGIYKHGQTNKTELCNLRIISNIKLGKLSIAITKNTLNAKNQWEERLIKALKAEGYSDLKEVILIISSKKNDLNGNATHCKTINDAISEYTRGKYKIIFVCSNTTRIMNIIDFLESYNGITVEKRLDIDIQHDEAHNNEDGIPPKRELIEQIIINPYVKSYIPVSASPDPIYKEDSILWKKKNLEKYAIDYTKYSKVISTDMNYSSIADANKLTFEKFKQHKYYQNYNLTEFDEETFDEAENEKYSSMTDEELIEYKNKHRKLEFCNFMKYEIEACNLGMNYLDNFYIDKYTDDENRTVHSKIILEGVKRAYLITTPCRIVLTIHLIKWALGQSYNPICIGIYKSQIHIWYNEEDGYTTEPFGSIENIKDSNEINTKISNCLKYLKEVKNINIERPIIIIGNYDSVGESITLVNYEYGTLRSNILLPSISTTREVNYQAGLRLNYMDTLFRQKDPKFKHPPKWLIGSEESIRDCCLYEKENDERIMQFKMNTNLVIQHPDLTRTHLNQDNDGISIPCKLVVLETDDDDFKKFREMITPRNRTDEEKSIIFSLIKTMIDKKIIEINDPTGKLVNNFINYKLRYIRTYKKHTEEEIKERKLTKGDNNPFEADYRFREYEARHIVKSPYINNKSQILPKCCEMLVAYDLYEYDAFTNRKTVMWLSYRYE